MERYREELLPAADTSFRLGYFGDGNIKFSITSEIQLGKALSLVKKSMVTMWVDPHVPKESSTVQTIDVAERKVSMAHLRFLF